MTSPRSLSPATWIMRDGGCIPVRKMTDSHLANTISFLKRRLDDLDSTMAAIAGCGFGPDSMASYYADSDFDRAAHESGGVATWLRILQAEQKRRENP